jgi:hypothetical protein
MEEKYLLDPHKSAGLGHAAEEAIEDSSRKVRFVACSCSTPDTRRQAESMEDK